MPSATPRRHPRLHGTQFDMQGRRTMGLVSLRASRRLGAVFPDGMIRIGQDQRAGSVRCQPMAVMSQGYLLE